ncbi:MAG: 50S ribosomal protein L10 [Ignisphaera sp.]
MKVKFRKQLEVLTKVHKLSKEKPGEEQVRSSIDKKRIIIEETKKLLKEYRTVVILDNANTPSKLYRYIRQRYSDIFYIKMIKNTLLLKAMEELGISNTDEIAKYLKGSCMVIFTNVNSFEAKLVLDKISVPYRIKPGEKIEHEIVIPPIRTELKPGPVMSLFGRLKIPIQVRDGVIWIARESTIARPGDVVTPELVSVFEKLGIEPKLLKPNVKVAYEEGLVIPADKLAIDIEGTRTQLLDGLKTALSFAVELVVPEPNVVKVAISRAYLRACNLAAELGVVTKETASLVVTSALRRAYALASVLAQKVPELASIVPQAPQQLAVTEEKKAEEEKPKEEKEEEKETVSEEQLAEGLTALFG